MTPIETLQEFVAPILCDILLAVINWNVLGVDMVPDLMVKHTCQRIVAQERNSQFPTARVLQNVIDMQSNRCPRCLPCWGVVATRFYQLDFSVPAPDFLLFLLPCLGSLIRKDNSLQSS